MKKLKNIIILFLAILLLTISFFIDSRVQSLFSNTRNHFFDFFMAIITNFLVLFFVLFLAPALFLLRRRKFNYVFCLSLSFISSVFFSLILKLVIARSRPLSGAFFGILNYSFPSMHALVAFAALPILDREFPKLRVFWISFAFFVAVSRLYFSFHYFSDIVGGALIGYAAGLLFINLEQKYKIFKRVYKK